MATDPAGLLNYSAPRCFFEREYRYRSKSVAVGTVIVLLLAGFMASIGGMAAAQPGAPQAARIIPWLIAAALLAVAAWAVFNAIRGVVRVVRVTEEGIDQDGRVEPWGRIASVGGTPMNRGIMLEYTKRPLPGRTAFGISKALQTTPALQRAEFDALIRVLADYLSASHRHVKVNPEPRTNG